MPYRPHGPANHAPAAGLSSEQEQHNAAFCVESPAPACRGQTPNAHQGGLGWSRDQEKRISWVIIGRQAQSFQ